MRHAPAPILYWGTVYWTSARPSALLRPDRPGLRLTCGAGPAGLLGTGPMPSLARGGRGRGLRAPARRGRGCSRMDGVHQAIESAAGCARPQRPVHACPPGGAGVNERPRVLHPRRGGGTSGCTGQDPGRQCALEFRAGDDTCVPGSAWLRAAAPAPGWTADGGRFQGRPDPAAGPAIQIEICVTYHSAHPKSGDAIRPFFPVRK